MRIVRDAIPGGHRRHHGRPARAGDRRALAHGLCGGARRDVHAEYLDTTRPEGVIGHPIFPVCYEWPLAVELRASALSESIAVRSVHATHDLRLHRRARAGDRLSTTATVISSEPRAPGPTSSPASRPSTPTAARSAPPTTAPSIAAWSASGRRSRRASPGSRTRRAMSGPFRNRTAEAMDRRHARLVGRGARPGGSRPYLYRVRADLESDPHRQGRRPVRRLARHHPARHRDAGPGGVRGARARGASVRAAGIARIACRFTGMVPLPSVITVEGWEARGATGEGRDRVSGARCRRPPRPPRRAAHPGRAA